MCITRTRHDESAAAMSQSGRARSFFSVSILTPRCGICYATAARTSGEFSPTPAVKARASIPLSATASAPTAFAIR